MCLNQGRLAGQIKAGGLGEGGGNGLKYLKRGCIRKQGRGNKDFKLPLWTMKFFKSLHVTVVVLSLTKLWMSDLVNHKSKSMYWKRLGLLLILTTCQKEEFQAWCKYYLFWGFVFYFSGKYLGKSQYWACCI